MKIALAQINPTVGDIYGNSKKIISIITKINADIVAFPELSITGYSPQDLLLNKNFVEKNIDALTNITKNTKDKIAIVGFIDQSKGFCYNSAAIIENQRIINVHHKVCLPNYSIFDEKRWFKEGDKSTVFEFYDNKNKRKIGVSICEDIWLPETTIKQKEQGAELIINISASPYRKGKINAIENVLRKRWEENKVAMIVVNQVGAQDGIVYFGHSMYFNHGKILKKCIDFEEDFLIVKI